MRRKCKITAFGSQTAVAESTICDMISGRSCSSRIRHMIADNLGMDEIV